MKYVYILASLDDEHFYVGVTDDVTERLLKHNAGEVSHTSKYRPWRLKTYIASATKCGHSPSRDTLNRAQAVLSRKSIYNPLTPPRSH
jgi:hypothetical protein